MSQQQQQQVLQGCKLREAFARDQGASLGLWQCLPGANVSRILARAEGVDWVLVDCEHGNIDGESFIFVYICGMVVGCSSRGNFRARCPSANVKDVFI